jgi:hypothetical protein
LFRYKERVLVLAELGEERAHLKSHFAQVPGLVKLVCKGLFYLQQVCLGFVRG